MTRAVIALVRMEGETEDMARARILSELVSVLEAR
jgi:hypothetical protein